MTDISTSIDVSSLLAQLTDLRRGVESSSTPRWQQWLPQLRRASMRASAVNLAHYLALRHHDLRELQFQLSLWGLSSLGRCESRVMPALDAVLATLESICKTDSHGTPVRRPTRREFDRGVRLLRRHARLVFGRPRRHRDVRIMVTLPAEAADNFDLIHGLAMRGMDCARINCAHENAAIWQKMIENVRRSAAAVGRPIRVCMDIAGPKARTADVITPPDRSRLEIGDLVLLTASAPRPEGEPPFRARCTLPEFLHGIRVGGPVWLDDGKVGFRVERIDAEGVWIRVVQATTKGRKLRADKGLNFPGALVETSPLSDRDRQDLDFIAAHTDVVAYSFVQSAEDVELLQRELRSRIGKRALPPLILKIETEKAVRNLPEMIIQAGGQQPVGVMIARGDLAVEIGFHRLAEMQEEILWLCEAAHVPVVWATQVLETLSQKGIPSRAEITDAAMAERAECVMLNKGPFVLEAVSTLDDVLTRMQSHQDKKTAQLRALRVWP